MGRLVIDCTNVYRNSSKAQKYKFSDQHWRGTSFVNCALCAASPTALIVLLRRSYLPFPALAGLRGGERHNGSTGGRSLPRTRGCGFDCDKELGALEVAMVSCCAVIRPVTSSSCYKVPHALFDARFVGTCSGSFGHALDGVEKFCQSLDNAVSMTYCWPGDSPAVKINRVGQPLSFCVARESIVRLIMVP